MPPDTMKVPDKEREKARWYFDVISPFAYLHFTVLPQLRDRLDIEYVPVLFAGLLNHWGQLGPAEIPEKRLQIYRHCTWMARARGLDFRFPPSHPFNPLPALRLILALGSTEPVVRTVFEFIYGEGRDVTDVDDWALLCARLDVTDAQARVGDPAVKRQLATNTREAVAAGVFGVPTLACRGELFWGFDTLGMTQDFLDDPALFEHDGMRHLKSVRVAAERRPELRASS